MVVNTHLTVTPEQTQARALEELSLQCGKSGARSPDERRLQRHRWVEIELEIKGQETEKTGHANPRWIPAEPLLRKVMSVSDPGKTDSSPITSEGMNTLRR